MNIKLVPVRMDEVVVYEKRDDSIIVDGEIFDFSKVGEGDTLPQAAIMSTRFVGDIDRINGELTLSLVLPLPWNYSQEQAFPLPLYDVKDGALDNVLPRPRNAEYEMIASEEGGLDE